MKAVVLATCALLGGCIVRAAHAPATAYPAPEPGRAPATEPARASPATCSWEDAFEVRYGQPFRAADVALVLRGGDTVRGLDRLVPYAHNDIIARPAVDDGSNPDLRVVAIRLIDARDGSILATRDLLFLDAIGKALHWERTGAVSVEEVVLRQFAEPEPTPADVVRWLHALYGLAEAQLGTDEIDSFRIARDGALATVARFAHVQRSDRAMGSSRPLGSIRWIADFDMAAGFDPVLSFDASYWMSSGDYEPERPREQHRRVSLPLTPSCP